MKHHLFFNQDKQLEDALAMLAAGIPLEDILMEAGNDAEWLRALLEVATDLVNLHQTTPLPSPEASLNRLLDHGQQLRQNTSHPPAPAPAPARQTVWSVLLNGRWLPRMVANAATGLLTLLVLIGGVYFLADNSLPGQALYRLKGWGETIRLSLVQDSIYQEYLIDNFNKRRQIETRLLLRQGEQAHIAFEGYVQAVSNTAITIDDLTAQITSTTQISGALTEGTRVHLEGETQPSGILVAERIILLEAAPPTATPLPTATLTATSTPTALATATNTATPTPLSAATAQLPLGTATISSTNTLTPTPTASNTLTATPSNTASPTATPTKTPTGTPTGTPLPTATPTERPGHERKPTKTPTPVPVPTATLRPTPTVVPSPIPMPTPTLEASPTPDGSETATSTPDGSETATPTPDGSETATPTPDGSETATPTPDGSATATSTPDGSETVTPTPDGSETATPTPDGSETATPTPNKGATLSPTETPAPTATGEP